MNKRAISKENLNCRTTKRLRKNSFCIGSVLIVAGIISTGFLALGGYNTLLSQGQKQFSSYPPYPLLIP